VVLIDSKYQATFPLCYTPHMPEPKTKPTKQTPTAFLKTIEPEEKRTDSKTLVALFEQATGEKAVMWGTSIVGFGSYEIKKGAQVNKWPLVAFSPRKQNLTLYILNEEVKKDPSLKQLGKYKISGSCLHINKLADVDRAVLVGLMKTSFEYNKKMYT